MHWRRKWQPIPVFLPGESQGRGSLVGCRLWGHTELDTTEMTWQQQVYFMFYGLNFDFCPYFQNIVLSCSVCLTLRDPVRLFCPWDFPAENTGMRCHFFSPRGSCPPRNRTRVSCIAGGFFTSWAFKVAWCMWYQVAVKWTLILLLFWFLPLVEKED